MSNQLDLKAVLIAHLIRETKSLRRQDDGYKSLMSLIDKLEPGKVTSFGNNESPIYGGMTQQDILSELNNNYGGDQLSYDLTWLQRELTKLVNSGDILALGNEQYAISRNNITIIGRGGVPKLGKGAFNIVPASLDPKQMWRLHRMISRSMEEFVGAMNFRVEFVPVVSKNLAAADITLAFERATLGRSKVSCILINPDDGRECSYSGIQALLHIRNGSSTLRNNNFGMPLAPYLKHMILCGDLINLDPGADRFVPSPEFLADHDLSLIPSMHRAIVENQDGPVTTAYMAPRFISDHLAPTREVVSDEYKMRCLIFGALVEHMALHCHVSEKHNLFVTMLPLEGGSADSAKFGYLLQTRDGRRIPYVGAPKEDLFKLVAARIDGVNDNHRELFERVIVELTNAMNVFGSDRLTPSCDFLLRDEFNFNYRLSSPGSKIEIKGDGSICYDDDSGNHYSIESARGNLKGWPSLG